MVRKRLKKKSTPISSEQDPKVRNLTASSQPDPLPNDDHQTTEAIESIEGSKSNSQQDEGFIAPGSEKEDQRVQSMDYEDAIAVGGTDVEGSRDSATISEKKDASQGGLDAGAKEDHKLQDANPAVTENVIKSGLGETEGGCNTENGNHEEDSEEEIDEDEVEEDGEENDEGTEEAVEEEIEEEEDDDEEEVGEEEDDGEEEVGEEEDDGEEEIEDEEEDGKEEEDDDDDLLSNKQKDKELEIFVGGLHKGAVEADLIEIFEKFGEVRAVRIASDPITERKMGFAFIQYATSEQANKALSELNGTIEVKGKLAKISLSQGNRTLHMENICKTWTKEHVLEKLKSLGIEQIEEIRLPEDPENDGKIRGFALLGFNSHAEALVAFQRLKKPDAVFGCDISARVAFAQTSISASEEVPQVKTVFVEGLDLSWDEEKLRRLCAGYGKIEEVKLSKNMRIRRNNFGFVTFSSREDALSCVEGLNRDQSGGKVKAAMARLRKTRAWGGHKVENEEAREAGSIQTDTPKKSAAKKRKRNKKKGPKAETQTDAGMKSITQKHKRRRKAAPEAGKPTSVGQNARGLETTSVKNARKLPKPNQQKRRNLSSKPDSPMKYPKDTGRKKKFSQHLKGLPAERSRAISKHSRNSDARKRPSHNPNSSAYGNAYAREYSTSYTSYPGHQYGSLSASQRLPSDMEPHAGYIVPTTRIRSDVAGRYVTPAFGFQGEPQARHINSGSLLAHAPYDSRRTDGYDGYGSRLTTYAQGPALPPPPAHYVRSQDYGGYGGGAPVRTAYYYTSVPDAPYPWR